MGTMTFLDDTINGVPGTGASSATVTVAPDGNGNYTFNPFATTGSFASTATVVDAAGPDNLTLRLIFSDAAGVAPGAGQRDAGRRARAWVHHPRPAPHRRRVRCAEHRLRAHAVPRRLPRDRRVPGRRVPYPDLDIGAGRQRIEVFAFFSKRRPVLF